MKLMLYKALILLLVIVMSSGITTGTAADSLHIAILSLCEG